jgi:predicted branched-subunit amino acid permease
MRESRSGTTNAAFLLGSGLVLFLTWISAVAVGRITGGFVHDPARFGLDFRMCRLAGRKRLPAIAAAAAAVHGIASITFATLLVMPWRRVWTGWEL